VPKMIDKHVTLDGELVQKLEAEAAFAKVSISEVIRTRLHASYSTESRAAARLEIILEQVRDDVQKLLGYFEAVDRPDGATEEPTQTPVRVATYDEMYGQPEAPPSAPKRRGWWPRSQP